MWYLSQMQVSDLKTAERRSNVTLKHDLLAVGIEPLTFSASGYSSTTTVQSFKSPIVIFSNI